MFTKWKITKNMHVALQHIVQNIAKDCGVNISGCMALAANSEQRILSQHTISGCLATGRKITSSFTRTAIIAQRDASTRYSDRVCLSTRCKQVRAGQKLPHLCVLMKTELHLLLHLNN